MIATPEDFSQRKFHYLVVGGGTAGLVVAARLSEDSEVLVRHLMPTAKGMAGSGIMNERIDWCFTSVTQATANGRAIDQPRKGTRRVFCAQLTRSGASAEEYDGMCIFISSRIEIQCRPDILEKPSKPSGIPDRTGTSSSNTSRSRKLCTTFPADLATQYEIGWDHRFHGSDSPPQLTYPRYVWDLHKPWAQTLDHLGIPNNPEPSGGNSAGSTFIAGCVDPVSATRSYSTTAYYEPNQQRKNLVVLPEAQATRAIFDSTASPVVATGVEYSANGSKYTAHASQEVVLSAGELFSIPGNTTRRLKYRVIRLIANSSTSGALGFFHPSGIGDATLLKKSGIHTVIDLPAVGEIFRNDIILSFRAFRQVSIFETTDEWAASDLFRDPALRAKETDLVTKKGGRFSSAHYAYAFLPLRTFCDPKIVQSMKAEIANDSFYTMTSGLRKQTEYLTAWFDNPELPQIEMIQNPQMRPDAGVAEPGKKYQTLMACNLHPLSRGSVHIQSRDPLAQPAINPGYLRNPLDLVVLVRAVRFTWQLTAAVLLSSTIVRECAPGADVQTDEQIAEFVKNTLSPVYHPVGPASMLPREDGGMVDPRLVAYGTKNLRIVCSDSSSTHPSTRHQFLMDQVDASILPFVECFTCFESSEG
ncbi:hypothetical protein EW146_g4244 [Bondarzewia mesenterica]|uniref:Glucose-methanol-choline oxidoreductase C-terminal domain-containing protein n=1 Tax=Bondarzewia mesenterica TaxID=1095465 RepID=A0A4S4LV36_9AGAM|nr:hypothetical protein EW146_g4244 [Bondarzewia mesenterica]